MFKRKLLIIELFEENSSLQFKTLIIQVANTSLRDDLSDGHQKAEVVRAKQDMMNRIIQMEEKVQRTQCI